MKKPYLIISGSTEWIIHIIFWLLWLYLTLFRWDDQGISIQRIDPIYLSWIVINSSCFYLNYFLILPWVFRNWTVWKILLGLLVLLSYFVGLRYLIEETLFPIFLGFRNYHIDEPIQFYILDNMIYGIQPIVFSSVLWLVIYVIRLLAWNKQVIAANKDAEIKLLKSQINPHFLFNSLNNIYSLVHFKSEQALPAIDELGRMMRYSTYKSQQEWVDLQEEISYIQAYLQLEKLRLTDESAVVFHLEGSPEGKQIAPFSLIPYVENDLKHGYINSENKLIIHLSITDYSLQFEVLNYIKPKEKDGQTGIGLQNLKERLAYYYPDNHDMEQVLQHNQFRATLTLNLKPCGKSIV